MKNKLYTILTVALSISLILAACEGSTGPEGPQGAQGDQGERGPVGPAGEDGSVMYAGEGAPGSDIGSNGDYYLNQNTGELYGPKDGDGWGTPISLQGPSGEDGQDGSQIHAGSGAPNTKVGSVGDYYLDKTNYHLYGPKTSDGWGDPLNLKGADGNANVQVYEKDISDMTWEVADNNNYLYLDIPAPNVLTVETLNTSTILVYVYTSDFFGWGIVPYYTERNIRVTAHISVGNLQLRKDQDGNPSTQSWHNAVRIVVIENSSTEPLPLNRRRENGGVSATAINMADYPASAVKKLQ